MGSSLVPPPSIEVSKSDFRDKPWGSDPICDGFCNSLTKATCEDDGISYYCASTTCFIDDIFSSIPSVASKFDVDLYYKVKNAVLVGTAKGEKYIKDYYYLSRVLYFSDITPILTNLTSALPTINQALAYILIPSEHGTMQAISSALKADLLAICHDLKQLAVPKIEEEAYINTINSFENDLNIIYNKQMTIQELINSIGY